MKLYDALTFLDGWTYLWVVKEETVTGGIFKTVFSRETKGWLLNMAFMGFDAYITLRVTSLGQTAYVTPQLVFRGGWVIPSPTGGQISLYIRPSTLSTAGVYIISIFDSPQPMPIKGLTRLELSLGDDSTQVTSTAGVAFTAIEITDEEAFIRSVRKFKYGWLGWVFGAISKIPGLKYIGIPEEIREVVSSPKKKKGG